MDKLQLLLIYISSVIMAKFTHFEAGLDVLKDLADNGYKLKRDSEVEFQSNRSYCRFANRTTETGIEDCSVGTDQPTPLVLDSYRFVSCHCCCNRSTPSLSKEAA